MNKTSIIYLFLIALLFSACKDEITTGFDQPGGDKLTVTAVMPSESGEEETRVSLHEKSGSLQIESKWQTNDQIHFFFRQNGNIVDAGKVTVSNLANGGKQVSFEINYPQGINPSNPFDLYSFCGTEAKVKNGNLLVDINPRMCNYLENVSAIVWCEAKNISANNSSLSLNFKHLGTYELIHLNNKSSSPLSFNLCNLYPAAQSSDVWYHIQQKNGNSYDNCYYNPVSGSVEILTESATSYSSGSVSRTVLSGSIKVVSNWYFPNNKSVPETKLKLNSHSSDIISTNSRPSRNSPLQQSKAYHLYANWDGSQLKITDENFNDDEDDRFTDPRDGSTYKIVKIGNQIWMAENLKYLPKVSNPVYGSVSEPYYHVYGYYGADVAAAKATQNYKTHGVLYNWPAAIEDACPDGWHLPSGAEWAELQNYLIKNGYNYDGSHSDNKVAIAMAKPGLWENHGGTGTVGNGKSYIEYQNKSGFSGIPSGFLHGDGRYLDIGFNVYFWTANAYTATNSFYHRLSYDEPYLYAMYRTKASGFSVRCMRN